MNKVLNIITLGCSKNTVDSERITAQLARNGWTVQFDSDSAEGGVVVINTCGFIGDAKEESINTILSCAAAKTAGLIDSLYVIGCLSERYRDDLRDEIPEVDEFFGVRDLGEVVRKLGTEWDESVNRERILSTPAHYAYLKIAEGCNRRCGFCAIPMIRGEYVSVPMEQLVEEARLLAAKGVRELIVIAQDTTYYGMDIYGTRKLGELLRRLCRVDGIEWIRLHYAYPDGFPEDVLEIMREEPKICKYLDIPLQHVSDSQLNSMRRGITSSQTRALIEKIRKRVPGIAIRTTMLVGYPGESEGDFEELKNFIMEARFERLGVFPYSEEEGTYSGENLADNVPEEVKHRRAEELMTLQSEISLDNNRALEGHVIEVIIDRADSDGYSARSRSDSPEVDQEIWISSGEGVPQLTPGQIVTARIVHADTYDLEAELI